MSQRPKMIEPPSPFETTTNDDVQGIQAIERKESLNAGGGLGERIVKRQLAGCTTAQEML
jgi:hypothetical protein